MKSLLDLIKALYGPKALSSTLGTRTNVIRLPSGKLQKYISTDLNIEAASDAAAVNAYKEMEQLVADIPKLNDAERLIFEGNLRRLKNKLEASGLIKEGKVINESTIVEIQSKLDQLKQAGKELEKITGEKTTVTDVLKDFAGSQKGMARLQDEGLVRATARQIMYNDIKSGKLKASKEVEDIITGRASGDPIDSFRKIYGEDALEQLDSIIPNLRNLKTEVEAEKLARSKFKFEPDINRPPGSISIEEAKKAEQEFGINKPAKVTDLKTEATRRTSVDDLIDEYNANQDRLLLTDDEGGTLITYPEYNRLKDRNEQIAKILEEKGIRSTPEVETKPKGQIIPFRKKPTEPEGKAEGGIIGYANNTPQQSLGLDYLMGTEPPQGGYADGGRIGFKIGSSKKILDLINKVNKELKTKKSMETIDLKTGEVGPTKKPVMTAESKSRKLTKDEIADYEEAIGRDSEEWMLEGTVDEAEKALKKSKAEEAYYRGQYKAGKLNPEPGENSQSRMRFLRKKAEEAEATGDRRLITDDEMNELSDLESIYLKDVDEAYGVDTAIKKQLKDFTSEAEMIKQKYGSLIDDVLLKQILVDANPQRKAEVLATIDEALKMQQKGMSPQEIVDVIKNTTRTKQAKGGSLGLNYLMGL